MKWKPDILEGFEQMSVRHADGTYCTVIRPAGAHPAGRAVVYIHGFSDYFFQSDMAREFERHGWNFYAVDLRRYGRSLRPGDVRFRIDALSGYFPDIRAAIGIAREEGGREVVVLGHSTGGLTASLFMARERPEGVAGLMLNSPFLAWNLPRKQLMTMPLLSALGRLMPYVQAPVEHTEAYGESLHRSRHGEWDFRTDWKPLGLPPVELSWIRAVDKAQRWLVRHPFSIEVPVLLMTSDKSIVGDEYTPGHSRADAVLDVAAIRKAGHRLSHRQTDVVIPDGMHDLALSAAPVRTLFYAEMFAWLAGLDHQGS